MLLNTAAPLTHNVEVWLEAVGLMAVPWLVHVIALPMIFQISPITWINGARLVARGALFMAFAAMLFPCWE